MIMQSETESIYSIWNTFITQRMDAINTNIPSKMIPAITTLPWMDHHLKTLIKKKYKLNKQTKKEQQLDKLLKKSCKLAFEKAETDYINKNIKEKLHNNNTNLLYFYVTPWRERLS